MKKTIGERIKEALMLLDMKQSELAEKGNFDKGQLSSWISGKYKPRQNNIAKLAETLNVNEAWLMGYDVSMDRKDSLSDNSLKSKDKKDILDILDSTKAALLSQEGLMFDGDPASPEAIDSILNAMEIGMAMAKKKNKEKYTPKKYKKD